jgi:hypothetical protein
MTMLGSELLYTSKLQLYLWLLDPFSDHGCSRSLSSDAQCVLYLSECSSPMVCRSFEYHSCSSSSKKLWFRGLFHLNLIFFRSQFDYLYGFLGQQSTRNFNQLWRILWPRNRSSLCCTCCSQWLQACFFPNQSHHSSLLPRTKIQTGFHFGHESYSGKHCMNNLMCFIFLDWSFVCLL